MKVFTVFYRAVEDLHQGSCEQRGKAHKHTETPGLSGFSSEGGPVSRRVRQGASRGLSHRSRPLPGCASRDAPAHTPRCVTAAPGGAGPAAARLSRLSCSRLLLSSREQAPGSSGAAGQTAASAGPGRAGPVSLGSPSPTRNVLKPEPSGRRAGKAGEREAPDSPSPRRGRCRGSSLRRFYSFRPPPPRRPGPCTGRASVPRRLRSRAAASGALPPAEALCRPPRGATGAPTTRLPTATGLGLTAAATRPEATVSTAAAAGGSGAPRRGDRPRAGRRASAPGTRLPTAANPRPELPRTRSSTSARPGASRGTTRYGAGR